MTTALHSTLAACLLLTTAGCAGLERTATRAQGAAQSLVSKTLSANDAAFLDLASRAGIEQVTLGQLARREVGRPAAKVYAIRIVRDHTGINQQLTQLAELKGIDPPSAMDGEHSLQYNEFAALSGRDFERVYLNGQASDQAAMLKLFQDEARDGAAIDVKAFAARNEPTLQTHIDMARKLGGRIVPPVDG